MTLPASGFDAYRMVTSAVTIPAGVTSCLVNSTVQVQPPAAALNDTVYFRNAVNRNGTNFEDGAYGMYLYNDGQNRKQPPMTRSSVITVSPGQVVSFGAYFGGLSTAWYNATYALVTSYFCS